VPLAERALRAEPVPVAAASLRRRRPKTALGWCLLPFGSRRGSRNAATPRQPRVERCERSERRATLGWLSDATYAVERLVWHRDQVDRRPQFNEFRGGQMRPRPRAAERPSVCSAWVSGQFPPAHRRFAPRTGLSSGRPLEGYSGHLTVTTRKHDPVRSSHGHRSQCDARTPNSKLDRHGFQ
jgi:hypothetical protein